MIHCLKSNATECWQWSQWTLVWLNVHVYYTWMYMAYIYVNQLFIEMVIMRACLYKSINICGYYKGPPLEIVFFSQNYNFFAWTQTKIIFFIEMVKLHANCNFVVDSFFVWNCLESKKTVLTFQFFKFKLLNLK